MTHRVLIYLPLVARSVIEPLVPEATWEERGPSASLPATHWLVAADVDAAALREIVRACPGGEFVGADHPTNPARVEHRGLRAVAKASETIVPLAETTTPIAAPSAAVAETKPAKVETPAATALTLPPAAKADWRNLLKTKK